MTVLPLSPRCSSRSCSSPLGTAKILALAPMRARAAHARLLHRRLPGASARSRSPAPSACCSAWSSRCSARLAGAGLLLLLAGAVVAHLRNGDEPRKLAPAVVCGLLVAAYLAALLGAPP